jgi:DNA-binding XRE family transcriptional regulator
MSTKKKSDARKLLEKQAGGPLTIGNLLESIRLGEEMTQVAFAKSLGISRQNLCDIEKGRQGVSPKKAAEFSKKLGYSKQQFVRLAVEDYLRREGVDGIVRVA